MVLENNQNLSGEKKKLDGGYSYEMIPQDIKDKNLAIIAKRIYEEQVLIDKIINNNPVAEKLAKVIPLISASLIYKKSMDEHRV